LLFVSVSGYPHLEQGTGKYSAFLKQHPNWSSVFGFGWDGLILINNLIIMYNNITK
jgi:hypothetical protein